VGPCRGPDLMSALSHTGKISRTHIDGNPRERAIVDLSNESLLVIIGVGVAAGWLGYTVRGTGFGLLSDMAIGIVGALVGDGALPRLNVQLGVGIGALVINAAMGAIALLLIVKFGSGGTGWRGGLRASGSNWRRRW
jgi:uncharacterized membrane protein YeaQ/YmgE (transglycosylase-associated protein family)